ncbi:YSIRK-type signal peptide-containing protein [Streptococcus dysgalactiae]
MARKNTNKQFSLRKLKTGMASVAVALTVVGAGQTVKADESASYTTEHYRHQNLHSELQNLMSQVKSLVTLMNNIGDERDKMPSYGYTYLQQAEYLQRLNDHFEQYFNEVTGNGVKRLAADLMEDKVALKEEIQKIKTMSETLREQLKQKEQELKNKKEERDLEHAAYAREREKHEEYVRSVGLLLEDRAKEKQELQSSVEQAKNKIDDLNKELAQKEEELAQEKLAKQGIIDSTYDYVTEKESEIAKLKEEI